MADGEIESSTLDLFGQGFGSCIPKSSPTLPGRTNRGDFEPQLGRVYKKGRWFR